MTLANSDICVVGKRIVLVPYRECHVLKYHSWMQDPVLQEMTASEPLSLREEYVMQQTWLRDSKKCTFIICLLPDSILQDNIDTHVSASTIFPTVDAEVAAMVGDVNLFLDSPNSEGLDTEIDVMVAESDARRQGIATEAIQLMMRFGIEKLKVTRFVAKILNKNLPSLSLFQSAPLQFSLFKLIPEFSETHLELKSKVNLQRILELEEYSIMRVSDTKLIEYAAASNIKCSLGYTQEDFDTECLEIWLEYECLNEDEAIEETILQLNDRGIDLSSINIKPIGRTIKDLQ